MRLLIDTSGIQFRVAGACRRRGRTTRTRSGRPPTRDGRPIWTVRLDAIDTVRETKETIWVEVAGDEPKLTFDGYALVRGLVFAPWVGPRRQDPPRVPRRGGRALPVRQVPCTLPDAFPASSGTIPLPRDQNKENPMTTHRPPPTAAPQPKTCSRSAR